MLNELKALNTSDILGSIVMGVFLLGWIDFGQGPAYTWYNVIVQAAEYVK
jgi:hypothetical protein